MCEGVCVSSGLCHCTLCQHASFTYCLGFEGELSCMFDHKRKHNLGSPAILAGGSLIFWILSEPCGNADLVTFLHSHGIFANNHPHCRNRLTKNVCLVSITRSPVTFCYFHPSPLVLASRHTKKKQVASPTQLSCNSYCTFNELLTCSVTIKWEPSEEPVAAVIFNLNWN